MKGRSPLRAAIYVRVSSDDQKKGYGPRYQREETLKVAVERDGCKVAPSHIIDDSKSGSTDNRPGWQKILALARARAIDVVYFWKLDRMMRDEYYYYVNEKELRDSGVELRFATQDLKDPFNRAIQVAVAAEERRKIRERTYAGRVRAIRDGKWIGIPPYGYRKETNFRLKIYTREAVWVKRFFKWLVKERLSVGKIAKRAYELSAPTRYDTNGKKKPRNGPCFWSKGTLIRMLSSEVYTGTAWFRKYYSSDNKLDPKQFRPKDEWIRVSAPALISARTLQLARKQLAMNREQSPRRTKRTYLFPKKIRCGICGRILVAAARPNSAYKFYRGTYDTDNRCTECTCYSETALETAIWPNLVRFFQDPDGFMSVVKRFQNRDSRIAQLEQEQKSLAALEETLRRKEKTLLDCQLDGFYSATLLEEKRRELHVQRQELEQRKHDVAKLAIAEEFRRNALASAKTLYQKIQTRLDNADYETKRLACRLFIQKMMLFKGRADVWLRIPDEMATSGVVQQFSSSERADGQMSLRRNSYTKRVTKAPVAECQEGDSLGSWMPVMFEVEVKPRYNIKHRSTRALKNCGGRIQKFSRT